MKKEIIYIKVLPDSYRYSNAQKKILESTRVSAFTYKICHVVIREEKKEKGKQRDFDQY